MPSRKIAVSSTHCSYHSLRLSHKIISCCNFDQFDFQWMASTWTGNHGLPVPRTVVAELKPVTGCANHLRTEGRIVKGTPRKHRPVTKIPAQVCSLVYTHYDVIKWNNFPRHWPFWGESTGHRWIPLTKASDAELWCFLCSVPEQTVEQTIETQVIWDAITLIMTSL